MMDWMLWLLAALALAGAVSCAQAIRARVRPRRAEAIAALALGAIIVGWAVVSYLSGASAAVDAIALVADAGARSHLQVEARSELAQRFSFLVVAAMPALVLGIGFLGPGRRTSRS